MNVLFYISVETDSGDLTWGKSLHVFNVHLLMTGFDCPEVTRCG